MTIHLNAGRRYASRAVAVLLALSIYQLTRISQPSHAELARLAAGIKFRPAPLAEPPGGTARTIREVNPSLRHIAAWISTVGAAVALNDLDGDGLPNDVCHVDTRTDTVSVAPVPGTSPRYAPFKLDPAPLNYDPATMAPMGCLPADLNEDGSTDILVYYWGRTPVAFLARGAQGAGRAPLSRDSFVEVEIVTGGGRWYTNAATVADLDGDGHTDLIIGNYFADGARILDAKATSREQMQDSMSLARNGGRNRLLLWKEPPRGATPAVRFEDASAAIDENTARGWTLAIGAGDLDGDLLPEIYFANDFGPDRLLHYSSRPGALRFTVVEGRRGWATPKSKVIGHDSFKGMGVDFADLNGDGWQDIYVSNIAEQFALEESHLVFVSTGRVDQFQRGVAPYEEQGESLGLSRSGWGWDVRFGDFNNDGVLEALQAAGFMKGSTNRWPDLHELAMGNDTLLHDPRSWPNFQPGDDLSGDDHLCFFVRGGDGRFHDLAAELSLDQLHVTRGIATADVDGDGRLDFSVASQWDTSYFFHNESQDAGDFIGLRLRLPVGETGASRTVVRRDGEGGLAVVASRPAIGAQARVIVPGGRQLVAQVDGGNGHSGKRSFDLQFGLGRLSRGQPLTVELSWRDANGRPRRESIQLNPGSWYTVLLGREEA
jgi:hypothetical protein